MMKFLIKGLLRDKTRSLAYILVVAVGAFLTVFLFSWMQGVMSDILAANAKFDTGHVKITTRAYAEEAEQMPIDLSLLGVSKIMQQLQTKYSNMIWVPRIRFGGLIDVPDKTGNTRIQGPAMALAVQLLDPNAPDRKILNLDKALVSGHLPLHRNEILISSDFANKLGLHIGNMVTYIGSTMYGSMSIYNFTVAGTVRFGIIALDRRAVITDIGDARLVLDMPDGASEILGFSKDMQYNDEAMRSLAKAFNAAFSKKGDEFSPKMAALSENHGLKEYLDLADSYGGMFVFVFVLIMSMVLWNSGLINGIRRYGEIGVRLAMGETKGSVYRWMIFESVVTGIIGSIIGTALGLAISYYMQVKGIDVSSMLPNSTMMMSNVMRARVTPTSYYIGFIPGLAASVLGTMFAGVGIYKRQTANLFKELEV